VLQHINGLNVSLSGA